MKNTLFNRAFGGIDFKKEILSPIKGNEPWSKEMQAEFKKRGIKPTYSINKIRLMVEELKKQYPPKKKFNIISLIKKVFRWI